MDPNGFETADKCENGPQQGTPLGYAGDGSPYNQLIDGHPYLLQDIWSNTRSGCVQSSTTVASTRPCTRSNLRQFSSPVSGNLGRARRVPVARDRRPRRGPGGRRPGRDPRGRELGPVDAARPRRPAPRRRGRPRHDRGHLRRRQAQSVAGLDPDRGWRQSLHRGGVHRLVRPRPRLRRAAPGRRGHGADLIGPCGQTGVLTLRIGATLAPSPTEQCQTETDAAPIIVRRVGPGGAGDLEQRGQPRRLCGRARRRDRADDGGARRARQCQPRFPTANSWSSRRAFPRARRSCGFAPCGALGSSRMRRTGCAARPHAGPRARRERGRGDSLTGVPVRGGDVVRCSTRRGAG